MGWYTSRHEETHHGNYSKGRLSGSRVVDALDLRFSISQTESNIEAKIEAKIEAARNETEVNIQAAMNGKFEQVLALLKETRGGRQS